MDLITAMRKLGKKLTGKDYAHKELVSLIDDIAEDYEGGSSESDDSVISVNADDNNGLDKTYDEINEAFMAGKTIIVTDSNENVSTVTAIKSDQTITTVLGEYVAS